VNSQLARHVLDQLQLAGVREIVVCPGGRNAPFVELLAGLSFRATWHFEERSAAFFALGRARALGEPVAVCTTSGTAAGELLPAAMEGFYSGTPLILLTADRPRRFRASGAPQAAEQKNLFEPYTVGSFDLEGSERLDLSGFEVAAPLHVNVCFEEPGAEPTPPPAPGSQKWIDAPAKALTGFLGASRAPLVILGALLPEERNPVERFLLELGAPVYAEAPSGLRESVTLGSLSLAIGDRLFARTAAAGYPVDSVVRIGGVPTHRIWRDLEDRQAMLPVMSVSRFGFSGLGRASKLGLGSVAEILGMTSIARVKVDTTGLAANDHVLASRLQGLLGQEPRSEPGLFRALSRRIEPGAGVYLGNSLPIREWDLAATREQRGYEVTASRGLNGIDGQVSTFLGACRAGRANWALLGDLTALYDQSGPWVLGQMPGIQATIAVINNSGGRIFERMFGRPEFLNAHGLAFESWAEMWGMQYQLCHSVEEISSLGQGVRVVELRPDAESTARFWNGYEELLA